MLQMGRHRPSLIQPRPMLEATAQRKVFLILAGREAAALEGPPGLVLPVEQAVTVLAAVAAAGPMVAARGLHPRPPRGALAETARAARVVVRVVRRALLAVMGRPVRVVAAAAADTIQAVLAATEAKARLIHLRMLGVMRMGREAAVAAAEALTQHLLPLAQAVLVGLLAAAAVVVVEAEHRVLAAPAAMVPVV